MPTRAEREIIKNHIRDAFTANPDTKVLNLAFLFNLSQQTIYSYLHDLGLTRKRGRPAGIQRQPPEIEERNHKILAEVLANDLTYREIGEQYGVEGHIVRDIARRNNIKRKRGPGICIVGKSE
jgi:hypothetical protein